MKRFSSVTFLAILVIASVCKNEGEMCQIASEFNGLASKQFEEHYGPDDLGPLHKNLKCILSEAVANYLDELNNQQLSVIQSFYVRNYQLSDLGFDFSFVATKDRKFYFLWLPALHPYFYGYDYYKNTGSILELRDSLQLTVAKINSPLIDDFFINEVAASNNFDETFALADILLPEIFPSFLSEQIGLQEFYDSLDHQPARNRQYIRDQLDPIINKEESLSKYGIDYKIYHVKLLGFIFLEFYADSNDADQLKMNMYFIPLKFRYAMGYETERFRYKRCFENGP